MNACELNQMVEGELAYPIYRVEVIFKYAVRRSLFSYESEPTAVQLWREITGWIQTLDLKNPVEIKLPVLEWETWCPTLFSYRTWRRGRWDRELMTSFERYVRRNNLGEVPTWTYPIHSLDQSYPGFTNKGNWVILNAPK